MRGRLLFPLTAVIARLDTAAVATAGDYDPDFRTYVPGSDGRKELPEVRLPAQVEPGAWEVQQQLQAGNAPVSRLGLVFHFRDLAAASLIDSTTGAALIRVNDRLVSIYSRDGALLEQAVVAAAGGLFAISSEPIGLGLGGRRNLLLVTFQQRTRGLAQNP